MVRNAVAKAQAAAYRPRLGFTGHRNLGHPDQVQWVDWTLRAAIVSLQPACGYTCLAVGADQLFVQTLVALQIPYVAIVPCLKYEDSFPDSSSLQTYKHLHDLAQSHIIMDFIEPNEEAFAAAGRYLVETTEHLIAVWDGLPAKGPGGTGDVVEYARAQNLPIIHIDPIRRSIRAIK